MAAGNDLNVRASAVASNDGALVATAKNNINLTAGQATTSVATGVVESSKKALSKTSTSNLDGNSQTDVLSSSMRKIIVDQDPRIELATWPARTQAAVRSGKVVLGMTRQQVLMALGYPSPADTPNLASGTWHYWSAIDDTPIDIGFDTAGLLRDIKGSQPSIRMVRYPD